MKILIGILHCIENEYELCIQSLQEQSVKNWNHFVIRDLPNAEAHNALYSRFMEGSKEYDLFLKLDADMARFNCQVSRGCVEARLGLSKKVQGRSAKSGDVGVDCFAKIMKLIQIVSANTKKRGF